MKKLAFSLLFLVFSLGVFAQDDLRFGLYVDPALCWMKPMDGETDNVRSKFGWGYGLLIDKYFAERYAFSTGVEVIHNGGILRHNREDFTFNQVNFKSESVEIQYNLQYIQIPTTLKLKTAEFGFMTYLAQVGFTPGIKIQGNGSITPSTAADEHVEKVAMGSSVIKTFNLGLTVSGGIEYSLGGNSSLLVQGIFKNGFVNVTKDQDNVRLNYLALRVGFIF